jgi:putative ABC transport system permease protein
VHARTAGEPMAALPSIRAAVKSTDSRLSLGNPMPMTALVAEASADPRFSAITISTFAAAAVLLASIGLYGVVSFGVVRRRREIAIQLALGAPAHIVRAQVIRRAVLLSAGGLLIGLLVTIWVGRLMEGLLFEVTPTDPLTIGMVAAILLTVTLAAAAIPAARATAIDPVQTLRDA